MNFTTTLPDGKPVIVNCAGPLCELKSVRPFFPANYGGMDLLPTLTLTQKLTLQGRCIQYRERHKPEPKPEAIHREVEHLFAKLAH